MNGRPSRMTGYELGADVWDVTAALDVRPDAAAVDATEVLARLFDQCAPELVRALVAAGCADAAEIVQVAFASAVAHRRSLHRRGDPMVWIRRVAIRHALGATRSRRRRGMPADRQRLVVSLFYYLDLTVAEIAEAMNISSDSVQSHLRAARAATAHTLDSAR